MNKQSIFVVKYSFGQRYDRSKNYTSQIDQDDFTWNGFPQCIAGAAEDIHWALVLKEHLVKTDDLGCCWEIERYIPVFTVEELKESLKDLLDELDKFPISFVENAMKKIDILMEMIEDK